VNTDHNPLLLIFSIDGNKPDWSEDIENGLIEPWDTITRLDFSKNYNIESISVPSLGLSNLNLEINKKITFLDLYKNNFSIFDLSQVPRLQELRIQQNNLIELDVSGNPQLITLYTGGNQNLSCIQVSEDQLAKINSGEMQDWNIDSHTTFSLICN
jgi:hypothetical protein